MSPTDQAAFAAICYHILVTRESADCYSPDYLSEKLLMLNAGTDAFSWLDHGNQQRCLAYCRRWSFPIPEQVVRYMEESERAVQQLFVERPGLT